MPVTPSEFSSPQNSVWDRHRLGSYVDRTQETSWSCLRGSFLKREGLIEVDHCRLWMALCHGLGFKTEQKEEVSWSPDHPLLLIVCVLWPAASCFCCFAFLALMDRIPSYYEPQLHLPGLFVTAMWNSCNVLLTSWSPVLNKPTKQHVGPRSFLLRCTPQWVLCVCAMYESVFEHACGCGG